MTEEPRRRQVLSQRSQLYYRPFETDSRLTSYRNAQDRRRGSGRISIAQIREEATPGESPYIKRQALPSDKLATSRDSAFRFLRSVIPNSTAGSKTASHNFPSQDPSPSATDLVRGESEDMPSASVSQPSSRHGSIANTSIRRPSLVESARVDSAHSTASVGRSRTGSVPAAASAPDEHPIANGNGVSVYIKLAEPVLFLQGYDHNDTSSGNTAILRGRLIVKIQKATKLKSISLKFRGTASTKWPEGIPPKKMEFEENNVITSHTWPFWSAQYSEEGSFGTDHMWLTQGISSESTTNTYRHNSPAGRPDSPLISSLNLPAREAKRLSLPHDQARSFEKGPTTTTASKTYRTFQPGEYEYYFEQTIDSRYPETIEADLGFVKYELEATIERAGAFRANLLGTKEVTMIRAPSENSLERVEPIAISRNWEDQLHYDIVISGKSFPIGSKVPIAFKLTPLAKVQCHRIKVFVTENTEYFCKNKRVHRVEPTRKMLLFEKRPDGPSTSAYPGSTIRVTAGGGVAYDMRAAAAGGEEVPLQNTSNLLGQLDNETTVGPTEMELSVQLPGCHDIAVTDRMHHLHFDTTYENIQVHHWIKIVLRLSKPDLADPKKRRHFEISIDSPFHILSCRASQANTELPAYSTPQADAEERLPECNCPGAPRRRPSPAIVPPQTAPSPSTDNVNNPISPHLARPQPAHVHGQQRPIHLMRAPSFNPPAWSDEDPPPPLVTPPPQYNDIASPSHGLADYFSRLADTYDDEDSEEDDRASSRGRVNIPLTPGSRVSRSMDLQRNWLPVSH